LVNIKSRTLPPAEKDFRRITGYPSILFNGDCVEGTEEVYICEGEIDALTLWQAGIKNVVGVTCGAGTFHPEWIDQLAKAKKIFLCYDPDEEGQKGAREVGRRLGYDRCFNVALPDGQDLNEFFQKHDIFEFQTLVNEARQFDVSGIISIEQGFEKFRAEVSNPEMATGLMTPWPSVNQRIKTGFQPGELVVLSAPPKIGKSTWALQITTYNALQGIASLFFCLEMRTMKVIKKVIQCHTKAEELGPTEIEHAEYDFTEKPLYLGYSHQKPELSRIIETIKAAVQRYGLKLVVFDHLHFLCRSITNQVQEIGLAVQAFKFLAEEMEIPIILIAQPRKIQPDSIMTAMDLKDSISIYSDCDHLIILHRKRKASAGKKVEEGMETQDQAFEPVTLVRVEGSRYNSGGEALIFYHGEYSRFDEIKSYR
jgi:twinkle protein